MSYDFNDHADWATQEREMSEIKCPCCGSDLDYYVSAIEGDDDPIWYECMSRSCMFSCNGPDFPRIAAAMELAKACGDNCPVADYAALLARHNALREAVAWERKCDKVYSDMLIRDAATTGAWNMSDIWQAARAEVDRLLQEEN